MKKRQRKKNMKRYEQLYNTEMRKRFGESPHEKIRIMAQEMKRDYYAKVKH